MQNKGMYIVIFIAVVVILAVRIFLSSQQTETAEELRGTAESLQATVDMQASQIASLYETATPNVLTESPRLTMPPTEPNAAIRHASSTPAHVVTVTDFPQLVIPPTEPNAAIRHASSTPAHVAATAIIVLPPTTFTPLPQDTDD